MIELIIAILYVALGITLFKIDIDYNISGILSPGCFNGQGFNVLFIFYAALSPIVICRTILTQFRRLLNKIKALL